jgi:CMP/dCMP kinase
MPRPELNQSELDDRLAWKRRFNRDVEKLADLAKGKSIAALISAMLAKRGVTREVTAAQVAQWKSLPDPDADATAAQLRAPKNPAERALIDAVLQQLLAEHGSSGPAIVRPVVTIDGPAGCGKSALAAGLASRLGLTHLRPGAVFRLITLAALESDLALDASSDAQVVQAAHKHSLSIDLEGPIPVFRLGLRDQSHRLYQPEVSAAVVGIGARPDVRDYAYSIMRLLAARVPRGMVTEGQAFGSRVFPHADVKFWVTSSIRVRAERLFELDLATGVAVPPPDHSPEQAAAWRRDRLADKAAELKRRDWADASRSSGSGPLMMPPGAIHIDTTDQALDEVVQTMVELTTRRCPDLVNTST